MTDRMFEEDLMASVFDKEKTDGKDTYNYALGQVRNQVSKKFSPEEIANAGPYVSKAVEEIARSVYLDSAEYANTQRLAAIPYKLHEFVAKAQADLLGMGELEPYLEDQDIEDIAINGPDEIFLYKHGTWVRGEHTFQSPDRLLEILNRGISNSNRRVNMVTPIVDAILPGNERISVVTYPVVPNTWPVASIRSQRVSTITLNDLTKANPIVVQREQQEINKVLESPLPDYTAINGPGAMLSAEAASYLHAAVLAGLNIVVLGPTGVGKTTFLTALGRLIPKGNRILIIEDTPEIKLHPESELPNNVVYLRTRPSNQEGMAAVTQDQLVRLALRQRPDALTLGEARGEEIYDLLNALYTGHKNGLTSLHAYSANEMFNRIHLMMGESEKAQRIDVKRAAALVGNTLHIVITLENVNNVRRVLSIVEQTGRVVIEGGSPRPEQQEIFRHTGIGGSLQGPNCESAFSGQFIKMGVPNRCFRPE